MRLYLRIRWLNGNGKTLDITFKLIMKSLFGLLKENGDDNAETDTAEISSRTMSILSLISSGIVPGM